MRRCSCKLAIPLAVLLLATAACRQGDSDISLPEVNEKNCNSDLTSKIHDRAQRNKFIDLCARRNGFKPSPQKIW